MIRGRNSMPRDQCDKRLPRGQGAGPHARAAASDDKSSTSSPHRLQGGRGAGLPEPPPDAVYLTGPQVCARYQISDMTLWRWLHDAKLGFPQPALRVRDRRYWLLDALLAWESAAAAGSRARGAAGAAPTEVL